MPQTIPPSIDGLVLAAVAREVRAHAGAQFAGVQQPDPQAIVVALRGPRGFAHLYASIHPQTARVHLAPRPETAEPLAPFGQLLRSRLTHARLAGVTQPPFNRVLELRFDALEGPLTLIVEIMGRHSNAILTGGPIVVGALKVVTPQMSPRRPVLPGRPYAPPPADRPPPDGLDATAWQAVCDGPRPIWQQIASAVLGLGPVLAREVALRADVDPMTPALECRPAAGRLRAALADIASTAGAERFSPTAYEDRGRVVAFAAAPLRVYAHLSPRPAASMSDAIARYYRDRAGVGPVEERRRALQRTAQSAVAQRRRALEENRRLLAESAERDRYRVLGELLLAYASRAARRAKALVVPGHGDEGELTIPLDPALSAVENAQRYFHRYAKARAAARAVPDRIARLDAELAALREVLVHVATAESMDDLAAAETDLEHLNALRRRRRPRPERRPGPRRSRAPGGATLVGGRSGRENDHVTFHIAGPEDLWLHARGLAGAHVVLKSPGEPSEAMIRAAAEAAAYFSEGRDGGEIAVDYVARKHVRKPRGARPGTVTYSGERTVRVAPVRPAAPATERP